MLVWFIAIGVLGAVSIASRSADIGKLTLPLLWPDCRRPAACLPDPRYGRADHHGRRGAVCRHGALRPASNRARMDERVLPALLLCYAGQAALVLDNPVAMEQAFYLLAPSWAPWPMLILATAATVIASQSAITGAFSITAQAIQLGYLPRLLIRHTSAAERDGSSRPPSTRCFVRQ